MRPKSSILLCFHIHGSRFCNEGFASHVINIMFAAHINTAGTLTWSLLHCASDKALFEKVKSSISQVGTSLSAINSVKFLDVMIKEAIFQYSGMIMVPRVATEEYKIANVTVPKGGLVVPFPAFLEETFNDCGQFNVDRWERKEAESVTGYYPFGSGPHSCIGRLFAGAIVKAMFVRLFKEYELHLDGPFPTIDATKSAGMNLPSGNPVLKIKKC